MCDSFLENPQALADMLNREQDGLVRFLISPETTDVSFMNFQNQVIDSPSLPGILDEFPRFADASGAVVGSIPFLDAMGDFVYGDFALNVLPPGSVLNRIPMVFNEEVGISRQTMPIGYGMALASELMVEGLMIYDGTNFGASAFRVQTVGYLDIPGTSVVGDVVNRLASTATTSTVTNTFAETSIRVPSISDLTDPATTGRPIVSGVIGTDASLIKAGYSFPASSAGLAEDSLVVRGTQNQLIFTATDLTGQIAAQDPPDDFDFVRVVPEYATGTIIITRSNTAPIADPADIDTYINGSEDDSSQTAFVSQEFMFDIERSHRYSSIIASYTAAADQRIYYVNFGRIGVSILPSTSPWSANPGNVPLTSRIYREHDLVLHRGRRYYVRRDITPETNPVPGTTVREDGVNVGDDPFTPYNCGGETTQAASPFTAAGQILFSSITDIGFLNVPAANTGVYQLSLMQIQLDGFTRTQPTWTLQATVPDEAPEGGLIYPDEAVVFQPAADLSLSRELPLAGGNTLNNRFNAAGSSRNAIGALGSIPTRFVNNVSQVDAFNAGNVNNYSRPYTSGGFPYVAVGRTVRGAFENNSNPDTGQSDFPDRDDSTFIGVIATNAGIAYVDASGVLQVPRRIDAGFFQDWVVVGSSNVGFTPAIPEVAGTNSGFTRVYDSSPYRREYFGFMEKADNSFWIYGGVDTLDARASTTGTQLRGTNIANVIKVRSAGFGPTSTDPMHLTYIIALDSSGNLFFAGNNGLIGADFTGIPAVSRDFNQVPDFTNIVDFEVAWFDRRTFIIMRTGDGRAFVRFRSDNSETVWSIDPMPVENVIDVDVSGAAIGNIEDNGDIRPRPVVRILTANAIYTSRNSVPGNRVYNGSAGTVGAIRQEASATLATIPLPRAHGWARLIPGDGYGGVVDEDGRIAMHNPSTGCYAYV